MRTLQILTFLFFISQNLHAAELLNLDFHQEGEVSFLRMTFDKENVKVKKFHVTEDKQIIVDLIDVEAKERVKRAFDTSEFSGGVVFVSAYKKPESESDLRIALQLRDNVRSIVTRMKNSITLEIENRFGVFTEAQIAEGKSFQEKINEEGTNFTRLHVPKSDSIDDILENLTLSGKKKYVGKRVSFNVKNVTVQDILRMIADSSGFNIITTKEIEGLPTMSLNLINTPWDQVLDTILNINKLVASKNGSILMITTLEKATADKKKEVEATQVAKKEEPLVTKVFPISFAKIADLQKILDGYLTKGRGNIASDNRTNSLIVKDIPGVIEKMRKIVEVLDTQTPQVLIESKIVEVNEKHAKRLGLTNGFQFGYDPFTLQNTEGPGFSFSTSSNYDKTTNSMFGLVINGFNRVLNLNFQLELLEEESKSKIVANPKIITQNKEKATIESTDTQTFSIVTGTDDKGGNIYSPKDFEAKIKLDVTPQVTNDGSIALDIDVEKGHFTSEVGSNPSTRKRTMHTNVLVENGSTVMLGGIYEYLSSESHSGVPFLKDIPLIGWLFRTPYNPSTEKREVIIFLTPRVINQDEAGIGSKS